MHIARAAGRRLSTVVLLGALLAAVPGSAAHVAAAGPKCTAEQGQAFVNSGQYDKAI